MARILVRDLVPGGTYYLQVRANSGSDVSEWSTRYQLVATSDLLAPASPTGLSLNVNGTAFVAAWNAVTTNSDATPLQDFGYYEVKFISGANNFIVNVGKALGYTLTFEENVARLGTGASVTVEVRAVDQTGNKSVAASTSTSNPAPSNVANLVVTGLSDALGISWDKVADTDIKQYEVYASTSGSGFTPGSGNLIYSGPNNSVTWPTTTYSQTWVKVRAVDLFGTPSAAYTTGSATPKQSTAVDVTAPAAPTAVTVSTAVDSSDPTGGTAYIDVSWTAPADTDLQNYNVRYSTTNGSNWQYINVPAGTTSTRINELSPNTAYYIAVNAQDYSKNQSSFTNAGTFPITTAKDTTAPPQITGLVVAAGVTTVTATWAESSASDVAGGVGIYEIQLDTANTFSTGSLQTRRTNGTIISFSGLTSGTQYFVRVRAFDASGNAGTYSATGNATTAYVTNSDIQAGTISGDRITAASINGDRIVANTLDANTIKAGTTFSQNVNVGSTFTIATSGIMQSANYSSGSAGWQLTNSTLEINQGTIKAAALQLQQGQNVMHPAYADFEFAPAWYTGRISAGSPSGTASFAIATTPEISAKFGAQCLKITRSGATAGDDADYWLGANSSAYNQTTEKSVTYIFSAWILIPSGQGATTFALKGKTNDGVFHNFLAMTSFTDTGAWQRVSGAFTLSATTGITLGLSTETNGIIYVDGLQFEVKSSGTNSPSFWSPPGQTLIDGGIIRTGTIQSESTVTVNGASQPSWSINTAGGAQFGNAVVRGTLVVGTAGDPDAGLSYVSSGNYSAGTTGWRIKSSGDVEFNSGTFRGTLAGATINGGVLSIPVDASNYPTRTYMDQDIFKNESQATTNLIPDPEISALPAIVTQTSGVVSTQIGAPRTDWVGNVDNVGRFGKTGYKFYHTTNGAATHTITIAPTGTLATNTTYTLSFYTANAVGTTNAPVFGDSYANMGNLKVLSSGNDVLATGGKFYQFQGNIFWGANWSNAGANYTDIQTMYGLTWSKRVYITFTTPGTLLGTGVRLQLPVPCTSGGAAIDQAGFIDGLQLEQKAYATRYCDGYQPWCGWTGTANASTSQRNFGITNAGFHSSGEAIISADLDLNNATIRKLKVGSGPQRGSNFFTASKTASFTTTTGIVTNVKFDTPATGDRIAADDGFIFVDTGTETRMLSQLAGPFVYSFSAGLPASNTTNNRQIRITTQGGSVMGNTFYAGSVGQIQACISGLNMLYGGGYYAVAQVWQNSGSTLTWPGFSSSLPLAVSWAMVG